MRLAAAVLMPLALLMACQSAETNLQQPQGPPIEVVEPQYLVIRPLSQDGTPLEPLLNLSHFDMRTAEVLASESGGMYGVSIEPTPDGEKILSGWTAANIGKQLGVYLDGKLVSSPIIETRISSMILVQAENKEHAAQIVARMRRGGRR
jgi:preprotein translocase subunit SecD